MRRHALAILAVISLIGLGVLACGYVATFGASFERNNKPPYVSVAIYDGCLYVVSGYFFFGTAGNRVQIGDVTVYTDFHRGLPNAWLALSHFEARTDPAPAYTLAFPLWCLILPCTIAPILWLRRHRRRTPRGFAVEPAKQVSA